jgi:hypothetical protein
MDTNSKNKENENWHEHKMFKDGYGKFPYVILKVGYALFMQIPIHFNKNNDFINYPGTHINGISEQEIKDFEQEYSAPLHEKIIEHCLWIKNKIEAEKAKPIKMCLVEGPETSYYFDEDGIQFSTNIPGGGTLLTQDKKVIGMNVQHYL